MPSIHSGEEILPKASTPWVGCTNITDTQMDRRHTDRIATAKIRTSRSQVRVKIQWCNPQSADLVGAVPPGRLRWGEVICQDCWQFGTKYMYFNCWLCWSCHFNPTLTVNPTALPLTHDSEYMLPRTGDKRSMVDPCLAPWVQSLLWPFYPVSNKSSVIYAIMDPVGCDCSVKWDWISSNSTCPTSYSSY